MIFVRIEVVYRVFCSVERLDLRHSELCRKGEVQHPGGEWRFGLLYQGVHGDWSSALFQPELGWSVLGLLGRSADSARWAPFQKQETKRIGEGSSVASPMPKSVRSGGREDQLLRE